LGHGGGGAAGILARCSPERAGEGEEQGLGVMYDRFVAEVGAERSPRAGTTEAGGGDHGEGYSGKEAARPGKQAVAGASMEPRGKA
jgi:hypothetical protein